jgi:pimeloyl-[acyl-carrier protein] methyl ester esterase
MRLHHEVIGRGPDLVLLHGWGVHSGVWSTVLPRLAATNRVHLVDLPGHGRSPGAASWDLEWLADRLLNLMPAGSAWLGWSLGGLVALLAALRSSDRIGRLILLGATPRFVSGPGWTHAMAPELLEGFASSLQRDYRPTITRFLTLQLGDSAAERAALRELRAEVFRFGDPDPDSLRAGLAILRDTDLRDDLRRVPVPATIIHGGRDRLVPVAAGNYLASSLPRAEHHVFPFAGHAPFLSDPEAFVRLCREASRG